jgi:hypothetical protein
MFAVSAIAVMLNGVSVNWVNSNAPVKVPSKVKLDGADSARDNHQRKEADNAIKPIARKIIESFLCPARVFSAPCRGFCLALK